MKGALAGHKDIGLFVDFCVAINPVIASNGGIAIDMRRIAYYDVASYDGVARYDGSSIDCGIVAYESIFGDKGSSVNYGLMSDPSISLLRKVAFVLYPTAEIASFDVKAWDIAKSFNPVDPYEGVAKRERFSFG